MTELEQAEENESRGGIAFGALIAGLVVPGLGFLIAGRPKLGIAAAAALVFTICAFGWTRLVLSPVGYWLLLVLFVVIFLGSAIYSAWLAWRQYEIGAFGRTWKGMLVFSITVLAVGAVARDFRDQFFGFETFHVPAESMADTVNQGDFILVDTWAYRESGPAYGDLVVYFDTQSESMYLKRIVGLPGERLEVRDGIVVRDGLVMDEPYAMFVRPAGMGGPLRDVAESIIPPGHYYAVGDNRDNSLDSRMRGTISTDQLHGRVVHRWFATRSEYPTRF